MLKRTVKQRELLLHFVAVTSQKQNQSYHKTKSEACLAKSAALYRLKLNSQCSGISPYLFSLFFAPAVIYPLFWKNERFTRQVQLKFPKKQRGKGHHPLYEAYDEMNYI